MMIFTQKDPEKYCFRVGGDCSNIEWSSWWIYIFSTLSWVLLTLTLIGGVYLLVANLAKEQRLGSLNFIRLSPQSSQKILLGKLLGVPILIYLAVAVFLPLHLWANISSGLPLSWFFAFYGVLIIACCFFYNTSLLFAFLGVTQAWLAAAITGIFFYLLIAAIDAGYTNEINTLIGTYENNVLLRIGAIITSRIGLMIISGLILGSYWTWQAVNRRYRNPNATALSKKQSYWLMGCFQVYLMLFFLVHNIDYKSTHLLQESLPSFCIINFLWFLLVIFMLSPQRQSIQDWARYRHQKVNNDETAIVKGSSISLKKDLIWNEKSPALVAIGINLVITAIIWISWILLFWQNNTIKLPAILTLIFNFNLILIYAVTAQFILLIKVKNHAIWAIGILGALIFIPFIAIVILDLITPYYSPDLLLFSSFPWFYICHDSFAIAPMLIAIIGQWSVLISVTFLLTRKIQKLGASDSQELLTVQKD